MRAAVVTQPGGFGVFRVQEVANPVAGPELCCDPEGFITPAAPT